MAGKYIVSGQRVSEEKLRLARELRRGATAEERKLWRYLRGKRLEGLHFRRQQVIDGFIVDFYCHAAGLVVEVDGEIHKAQVEYDAERDCALARRGLRVMRISNEDVRRDISAILVRIAEFAAQCTSAGVPREAPLSESIKDASAT